MINNVSIVLKMIVYTEKSKRYKLIIFQSNLLGDKIVFYNMNYRLKLVIKLCMFLGELSTL